MKYIYQTLSIVAGMGMAHAQTAPKGYKLTRFSDSKLTPCPAVICAAPTGEVYVGVDKQGSLGKKAGFGEIVRLVDTNNDGVADKHTIYAKLNNPRGLISVGDKLYVLHCTVDEKGETLNQQLSVLTDADGDGVADGAPKALVTNLGNNKYIKSRGVDHSTNNIRLGTDGWIYISVGDFGFVDAEGTDGKKMTYHGGGIVRVRPDGTEMENFIHGTRNVYDVAIDPFMNVYTRENTNDGVGWWIRFSHYVQSGEYGYPSLYMNFPQDMLPSLGEYGSGSGCGGLFLQEPGWDGPFQNQPLLADWGRSEVVVHGVNVDGASFTPKKPETFLKLSQVTDLDVDASGRMYLSAWSGAGYKGNPNKGYTVRLVPEKWEYKPFPKLKGLSVKKLAALLASESFTTRTYAQQEILRRNDESAVDWVKKIISNKELTRESRVAGIYTLSQIQGADALGYLAEISKDKSLREHAIRCMADRKDVAKSADIAFLKAALKDTDARVQVAAVVALGRTGKKEAAEALLALANPPELDPKSLGPKGKYHSTPNSDIILPHVARQALIALDAQDACIAAMNSNNPKLQGAALFSLKWMHSLKVVDALIAKIKVSKGKPIEMPLVETLFRLHQKETAYDGSTWWSTRPNPHGPYYYSTNWEGSSKIDGFMSEYLKDANDSVKDKLKALAKRNMAYVPELNNRSTKPDPKNKKKTFGKTAIEDIVLYVEKHKGNAKKGKNVIGRIGCIACHNVAKGQPIKGPDLAKMGNMSKADLVEALKTPGSTIAKSWVTITLKDGSAHTGTIVKETKKKITLHNIAGIPTVLDVPKVKKREKGTPLMSVGLCDKLTLQEATDLIEYIQSMDPKRKKK